ncbi:MAG TPA: S8 family serine peptidase, partial [Chloroflexia bacterium]|nr:S8 family serine peptidase [Chloroflexia bacterium]
MRRIYLWIGLAGLLLAMVAFILRPWNAQAAYVTALPGGAAGTTAESYHPQALAGVPLRENWWLTAPGINFDQATKITPKLQTQLDSAASQPVGFMIYLKAQANTTNNVADWNAKGDYVLNLLERVQQATQPAVLQEVTNQQALGNITGKVSTFTIINGIFVHGNAEAARAIARLNDVAYLEADHQYYPMDNGAVQQALADTVDRVAANAASPETVELGVTTVHAPQAWAEGYKGAGIVVGSIDTGVDYTHPALNTQYRGNLGGGNYDHNYNWWDSRLDAPRQNVPYDDGGHGTHTMGTVLGDDGGTNQIGVAPDAKWIAAKVFPNDGSSGSEEITPAEDFMIAPWDLNQENRRPDLRPNIVTNSWGDDECWDTDSWLITQVWIDDGIMPAFANGNAGPGAGTVGSPGGYPFLVGVGAITASNLTIAGFSSRGPSCYGGALKPDVVAPGVSVRSSVPGNGYAVLSGTSMATPHVAGVMALILDANPSLTYTDVMGIMTRTAYFKSTWGTRPNNNYGWGLVQADTAIDMALHGPHVSGIVDDGSSSIEGAHVTAVRQSDSDTYSVVTRASGAYSMTVLAGTYDVTVSAFGYDTATLTDQEWLTDTTPVLNVSLVPQTTYTLSGTLFENGTCTPLSGTVAIDPSNALVVHSDPNTGAYTAQVPAGTYTLTARAGAGYQQIVDSVTISGDTSHDFTFGPAYDNTYVVSKPAYNWIAGTDMLTFDNAEDGYSAVTLPFAFDFYTGTYTTLNVSTNGYATFNDLNYARMWANTEIPNPGPTPDHPIYSYPNNALYPYWDDLAVEPRAYAYGDVYSGVTGTAPNRVFVIEWRGVAGTGAPATFEIQLEETTNKVTFEYQDVGGPYGFGYGATEGIEDANGVDAIQFGFNEPGIVGNNTAFSFTMGTPPTITPCVTPTPTSTPPPVCTISFEDVPVGSTFYPFIQCLACQGIINGYPCGGDGEPCNPTNDPYFRPGNNVTRGQFAKIASNSAGFNEPPGAQQYEDVAVGSTFFDFVWRLSDRGYINGYPCGGPGEPCGSGNLPYFRPNANVTRGQLSKIDANAAGFN